MYAWIWRHLPFGFRGKMAASAGLVAAVVALLWFVVFPAAEPLLPFGDVQVSGDSGVPAGQVVPTPTANPSDFVIPYATDHDNAPPSGTPSPSRRN
ncbi:MAG TPA: hypothetical protein VF054_18330 [Micromonosporaceae bacterium]